MTRDRGRNVFFNRNCLAKGVGYIHVADFTRLEVVNGLMRGIFSDTREGRETGKGRGKTGRRHEWSMLSFHYCYRKMQRRRLHESTAWLLQKAKSLTGAYGIFEKALVAGPGWSPSDGDGANEIYTLFEKRKMRGFEPGMPRVACPVAR